MTRSERGLGAALLLLASILLPFCGGRASDSGSSESHFLGDCNATCAAGLSCVCGVCTVACDADTTCTSLQSGATCVPPSCHDGSGPTAACDVACTTNGDCAGVGSGYVCATGRCRSGGGSTTLTCDERTQRAGDAIIQALTTADMSCSSDADCVDASISSNCTSSCGAIVSKSAEKAIQTAIDDLNNGLCATFEADGCFAPVPPCTPLGDPRCVSGECVELDPATASCDERSAQARDVVVQAEATADKSCSTDADCVIFNDGFDCNGGCNVVLSATGAASVRATLDGLNAGTCASFLADGCSPLPLFCPIDPGNPQCIAGTCVNSYPSTLTCDQRSTQASQTVQQAIEAADTSCTTNADCVAFDNSSNCYYGCGAVLSTTGAKTVQSTIDDLNSGLCATFQADGCTAFPPPCPFPGNPGCFAGTCLAEFRAFGEPCSDACGNQCYVPGTGGPGICSAQCVDDTDCEPSGICQASGGTGKWCFRRCASDAECQSVNGDTQNPLYCAQQIDPASNTGYQPLTGPGEGFCIQSSEP